MRTVHLRDKGTPLKKKWRECVGAGTAQKGLHADWQRQFEITVAQCGFERARLSDWNKLDSDDMRETDALCDFLTDMSVSPIIRMQAGGAADNLEGFARHAIARYGARRAHSWKFEAVYNKTFEQKALALKGVDPFLQVGAVTAVLQAERRGAPKNADFLVINGPIETLEDKSVNRVLDMLDKLPKMPVHWDGVNTPHAPEDGLKDALTLTRRHLSGGLPLDSLSLVSFSGICKQGAYLVDDSGVRQPSGHAYRMMDTLGSEELLRGGGYLVTKDKNGKARAMAWTDASNPDSIEITGMAPFERLMIETLDAQHGFAYPTWCQMGKPKSPTRYQAQALRQAALQTDVRFARADSKGSYTMELPKDKNMITLLKA